MALKDLAVWNGEMENIFGAGSACSETPGDPSSCAASCSASGDVEEEPASSSCSSCGAGE